MAQLFNFPLLKRWYISLYFFFQQLISFCLKQAWPPLIVKVMMDITSSSSFSHRSSSSSIRPPSSASMSIISSHYLLPNSLFLVFYPPSFSPNYHPLQQWCTPLSPLFLFLPFVQPFFFPSTFFILFSSPCYFFISSSPFFYCSLHHPLPISLSLILYSSFVSS